MEAKMPKKKDDIIVKAIDEHHVMVCYKGGKCVSFTIDTEANELIKNDEFVLEGGE